MLAHGIKYLLGTIKNTLGNAIYIKPIQMTNKISIYVCCVNNQNLCADILAQCFLIYFIKLLVKLN